MYFVHFVLLVRGSGLMYFPFWHQVHFHEVGAIDSIVDTVGVVYALHLLGVEKVFCSALPYSEVGVSSRFCVGRVAGRAFVYILASRPVLYLGGAE